MGNKLKLPLSDLIQLIVNRSSNASVEYCLRTGTTYKGADNSQVLSLKALRQISLKIESGMKYKVLKEKWTNPKSIYDEIRHPWQPRLVMVFEEFPQISCQGYAVVDLEQFRTQCDALKEDEVFVLGRADDCEVNLCRFFRRDSNGHFPCANMVSRYHCFIRKCEGYFELWDTSASWTAILALA